MNRAATRRRRIVGPLVSLAVSAVLTSWAAPPEDRANQTSTRRGAEVETSRVRVSVVLDGDNLRVETHGGADLGRVRLIGIVH